MPWGTNPCSPGGGVLASNRHLTPRYNLSWNEVGSMELQLSTVPQEELTGRSRKFSTSSTPTPTASSS